MVIAIGKYTESYKSLIEKAPDGYVWRFAEGEVDETCFEQGGRVFTDTTEILQGITEALEGIVDGTERSWRASYDAVDFAYTAVQALLYLETPWPRLEKENA